LLVQTAEGPIFLEGSHILLFAPDLIPFVNDPLGVGASSDQPKSSLVRSAKFRARINSAFHTEVAYSTFNPSFCHEEFERGTLRFRE
jgi:hypothetical protein